MKKLINLFKFNRVRAAAKPIAEIICDSLPFLENVIVTHVPAATTRLRQRGYDQSELLAKEISQIKNLKYRRLLAREGQSRQVGSFRRDRTRQVRGSYRAINLELIAGKNILLIDDISTTGATLTEAGKILRQCGAKSVEAAVAARVV